VKRAEATKRYSATPVNPGCNTRGLAQDVVPKARSSPYGMHLITVSKIKLKASYLLVDIENNNNYWIGELARYPPGPGSLRHGVSTVAT
jgi:hypothetical protein